MNLGNLLPFKVLDKHNSVVITSYRTKVTRTILDGSSGITCVVSIEMNSYIFIVLLSLIASNILYLLS